MVEWPRAELRMDAEDCGTVLLHGDGPEDCDVMGARDIWVFEADGAYGMHYDGAGPDGWKCCLATSRDLLHWDKRGCVLELGKPGEDDSGTASYGVTCFDGRGWHLFYVGSPNTTPPPDRIPAFPYLTLKARANSPWGPWHKQRDVVPFRPQEGTYYSDTASPGHIVWYRGEYLQFFSASVNRGNEIVRAYSGHSAH